jgi:hypothetical protein
MLKDQNKIDDLFNDFLHDHEEEVPAFIWTNLEGELKAKKRLRILHYLKAVAASIALFITFTLGYYVSDLHIISDNALDFKKDSLKLFSFIANENSENNSELQNDFIQGANSQKRMQKLNKQANESFRIANYNRIKIYEKNQLYRRYQFIKNIFSSNKTEERSVVLNSLNEKQSNQLLTDTLLLEKENLPEGGFLLTEKKDKASAWSFGTKFSPVITVSDNAAKESSNINGRDIKSEIKSDKPKLNSEEKPLTSYTGGINVNYKVSKRLSVESGLYYSQRKQGTDNLIGSQNKGFSGDNLTVYTPAGTQSVGATNNRSVLQNSFSTTYYMLNASFISNAEYIELPLIIRYKLIDQKIGLDVLSGVSSNFLVNNSSYILSGDRTLWTGNNKDLNSILYGATVGLGVNYNFYQNFSFNLEPTFKYTILSENSVFSKYPYSFAVFAGFSYRFK